MLRVNCRTCGSLFLIPASTLGHHFCPSCVAAIDKTLDATPASNPKPKKRKRRKES